MIAAQDANAVDRVWTPAEGDFNLGSNWNLPFDPAWGTADRAVISNSGVATLSSGTITLLEVWVGQNGNGTGIGTFAQTGGSLTLSDGLVVGRQGTASGTFSLTGGTLTTRHLRVGGGPGPVSSSGTATISGAETVFNTGVGAVQAIVGIGSAGTGIVTLDQGAVWNAANSSVVVGGDNNAGGTASATTGGTGTLNIRNGASLRLTAVNLAVGRNGNSNGTVNVSDGGILQLANSANSDSFLNLGNLNGNSTIPAGAAAPVSNIILSGANSAITVPRVLTGPGTVSLNLNGGTFTTRAFAKGSGSAVIRFNGTTLVATESNGSFFNSFPADALILQEGGLKFDTNDSFVSVPQGFTGSGTLTKQGEGMLSLAGGSHTGNTEVTQGMLELYADGILSDSSTLRISSESLLLLNFTGTDTIASLVIDGVAQAEGTWGAEGSGADHESSLITGEGLLRVVPFTQSPFAGWAGDRGLSGADTLPGADPDGDGHNNLLEFVLGGEPNPANPGANSDNLAPLVSASAGGHVFSFRRSRLSLTEAGLEVIYQHASTLSGWVDAVHGENGVTITTTQDGYGAGIDRVDVTIPDDAAGDGRRFVRLRAVKP